MNIIRKKLIYMSVHRGCKEMDLILGKFAISEIFKLSDDEVKIYAKLIQTNDTILYNILAEIILNRTLQFPHDLAYAESLIYKIAQFHCFS